MALCAEIKRFDAKHFDSIFSCLVLSINCGTDVTPTERDVSKPTIVPSPGSIDGTHVQVQLIRLKYTLAL